MTFRANPVSQRTCLLIAFAAYAWSVAAGDRRDIVFDCPCSAEWVAAAAGDEGTLTLWAGVRNDRATQSADVVLSPVP